MASLSVLFKSSVTKIGAVRAGIGVIELDATISAAHVKNVTATVHPVERGAKVTDHLRAEPDEVTIEGLVTNTPISQTAQTRAVNFAGTTFQSATSAGSLSSNFGTPGYAEEAFAKLTQIAEQGALVTLATELKTYTDMALVSLNVPRDKSTGDALRFTATFRKIVLVENKVTLIVVAADPRANAKLKAGRQALKSLVHNSKVLRKLAAPWTGAVQATGRGASDVLDRFKILTGGV